METKTDRFRIKSGVAGTHHGYTGQKIIELRSLGLSYNAIMKMVGCSKSTIAYHLGDGQKEKTLNRKRKNRQKHSQPQKHGN